MAVKNLADTPLKISSLVSVVGFVVTIGTGFLAFDHYFAKSGDINELKALRLQDIAAQEKNKKAYEDRVDAMFYGYEMRSLRDRVLYLQDKVETGEGGTADRRDLRRLEARLREMETKEWPDMARRFIRP